MIRNNCPKCREEEVDKPLNMPFKPALRISVNRFWGSVLVFKDDKLCERHSHDK